MRGKNPVIETTLFVIVAYASMIGSEQEGGASGVLAVVAAGIFVATFAWPYVDDPHSMHNVWDWLEWIGNTLIFLLAGTIMGTRHYTSESIRAVDWAYMFLNYLAVNVARFVVIFLFFPLISRMGNGITWREAVFMSWGGLRGAVGLAMAMAVALTDKFHGADGERFLFHVGGMALLTLVINGSTGAALLKALGLLTSTPAQARHIDDARHKMSLEVKAKYVELAKMRLFSDHDPGVLDLVVAKATRQLWTQPEVDQSSSVVIQDGMEHSTSAMGTTVDDEFLATIRHVFLSSLKTTYEGMVHGYELPQESGNILLHSTKMAVDDAQRGLSNWEMLQSMLRSKVRARSIEPTSDNACAYFIVRIFSRNMWWPSFVDLYEYSGFQLGVRSNT
jgi:NhaP-type Na+/H+ or K+/H+ antiporter